MQSIEPAASATGTPHPPQSDDWSRIHRLVVDIHIKQGFTLRDTIGQLKQEGYLVSERMLKKRMREEWHIGKYNTDVGMRAVLRKAKEREAEGKTSEFVFRARPVGLDEVKRYFSRKGIPLEEVTLSRAPTPPGLIVLTPRNSPEPSTEDWTVITSADFQQSTPPHSPERIPSPVPDSRADMFQNNLVRSIQTYYSTMFLSDQWVLAAVDFDVKDLYPSMEFGSMFNKYHNLRVLGKFNESLHHLLRAFEMVKPLLRVQDPRLLTYLLESVAYNQLNGYAELAVDIVRYFAQMSHTILGPCHPITIFAACLWLAERTHRPRLLEVAVGCMLDQFERNLGPGHVETMRFMLTASTILKHQGSYTAALPYLDRLQGLFERVYGRESYQACHALVDRAHLLRLLRCFDGARGALQDALARAILIVNPIEAVESVVRSHMGLATLADAQDRWAEKMAQLHSALAAADGVLEETQWMVLETRAMLAESQRGRLRGYSAPEGDRLGQPSAPAEHNLAAYMSGHI